ncbi:MAG: PAS domain-containing protein [Spirochaetes bacterium]|nr:MAG: PAS domain-containing protein [Spirochaetota bacterium]
MLLSYLSFFTFISCIALGLINLFLDSKAKLNRAFFLLSASSALWAFAYIFIFIADDKETIWLWYRISAPGGLFLLFSTFNFLYIFAGLKDNTRRFFSIIRILYFLFILYLIYVQATATLFVVDFVSTPYGNAGIINTSLPGYYLTNSAAMICLVSGGIFLFEGNKYNTSKRYRIQIKGLVLFMGVPIVLVALFNFILPAGNIIPFPFVGVVTLNFTVAGIFYLITRFKLLRVDYSLIKPEDLVSHLSDMIMILDMRLRIVTANRAAEALLSLEPKVLEGIFFPEIIHGDDGFKERIKRFVAGNEDSMDLRLAYRKGEDDSIVTDTYLSKIKDTLSDIVAILVISKEIRGRKEFQYAYGISDRELEILDLFLSGLSARETGEKLRISRRTVETHLTSIYNRTGINNKAGLFNLCAKFKLLP